MNVKPVHEEPEVTIFAWHFVQDTEDRTYRLVGYRTDDKRGRITSTVADFDFSARTVVTFSGRVYHLQGDQDPVHAARILRRHIALWGLPAGTLKLADVENVAFDHALYPVRDRFN